MFLFTQTGFLAGCAVLGQGAESAELESKVARDQLKVELYQKAEAAYQERNIDDARDMFEKLASEFPDMAVAHYRLGNIAFLERDLDSAGDYFDKAVSLKPRDPKAQYNLAMVRLLQAEKHLKFYTATADPETDIKAIATFLGAIDRFSNSLESRSDKEDSLDSIVSVIDKRN
jgi:outer membrane protein assembly factor BamD (BamD/ComL family)